MVKFSASEIAKDLRSFSYEIELETSLYKPVQPFYHFKLICLPFEDTIPLSIELQHDDTYSDAQSFCGILRIFSGTYLKHQSNPLIDC